jgi:cysteine desulfurase
MLPYFGERFGNASSTIHKPGRDAADAVDEARAKVAALIGGHKGELVFTSGATESNNLAILGLSRGYQGRRRRIVTSAVEHKAVLGPCHELEKRGFDIVVLPVDGAGKIRLELAERAINEGTLLVSVQAANNEVGTIQPISQLSRLAHQLGALIHCDAAQAVGRIPVSVDDWDIDLMSVSSHKLYGPKGAGALYVRGGPRALRIEPLFFGGGQEQELRPGTVNVPAIVGFGAACQLCQQSLLAEMVRIGSLRDQFESALMSSVQGLRRNGALDARLPGNSSLTFPNVDAEALIANTPTVILSTGSACTTGALEPSHVLLAIGLSRQEAYSTVRVGLGRFSTEAELHYACEVITDACKRILEESSAATQVSFLS